MKLKLETAQSGFTIIEVLVAAFILAVAVIGLIIGFNRGLTIVGDMREMSNGDRIAQAYSSGTRSRIG